MNGQMIGKVENHRLSYNGQTNDLIARHMYLLEDFKVFLSEKRKYLNVALKSCHLFMCKCLGSI